LPGVFPGKGKPQVWRVLRPGMEGKRLPDVTFLDIDGNKVRASQLEAPFVLYAYPKDDTPGCTKEGCGIRDAWTSFREAGLHVYGVSADDAESHRRFAAKHSLPFQLLTADEQALTRLGVWKEKSMYGRKFMGISRETFLAGPDGTVVRHYSKVKPEEHAQQLLDDYRALVQEA